MSQQRFRILLFNVGYATNLDGSLRNYFLLFYRYLYTPRNIIRKVRQAIYHLMQQEQPDVCCFVEIHKKTGCVPHPHVYTSGDVANKYGIDSVLRRLPFFRDNCNGFFAKGDHEFNKIYFKNGTKKLIYDIKLRKDLSLFIVHFSLNPRVRRKQCDELKQIIRKERRHVIVCGDFNIFRGTKELTSLAHACDLQIVTPSQATFPSIRPTRTLDLFLCPKSVVSASVRAFPGIHASDHLPVMLELQMA